MDDEQKTAQLFHNALNTLKGIDVFEFTGPILVLEHLKINKLDYAVMISDLRMPVINGVQLLKTIKDLNPSTRTILMTGYDIDNSLLQEYTKKEAPTDEEMKSRFPKTETKIISARRFKKKKYYDVLGNEINQDDPDILENIQRGDKIVYYHEEKSGEDKHHIVRR